MGDLVELTVTCTSCDTAFVVKHSPYSPQKSVKCPSCGSELPLPTTGTPVPLPAEPAPTGQQHGTPPPSPWVIENRYVLVGTACLILAGLFMVLSLATFQVYVPLAGLSLVFGVLAVFDRKPFQGLALIVATAVLGSLLHGWLLNRRHGNELRAMEQSITELQKAMGQPSGNARK